MNDGMRDPEHSTLEGMLQFSMTSKTFSMPNFLTANSKVVFPCLFSSILKRRPSSCGYCSILACRPIANSLNGSVTRTLVALNGKQYIAPLGPADPLLHFVIDVSPPPKSSPPTRDPRFVSGSNFSAQLEERPGGQQIQPSLPSIVGPHPDNSDHKPTNTIEQQVLFATSIFSTRSWPRWVTTRWVKA